MISGRLGADFSEFYAAAQKAVVSLRDFESGSAKVEASLNKVANSFSGKRIIQDAVLMTKAIADTGGASKLTASEMGRVNATVTEAIAKYAALGRQAPADMLALAKATSSVEAPTKSLSTSMVALGTFIGTMAAKAVTALAGLALNGITAIASGIGELVMSGGRLSAIQQSFEVLSTSVNTTGAAMLGSMRTGTRGLVGDLDLMQAANKAVLLGLPVTAGEMGQLAATATTLGRAMGQGATKSFDDLITALGRSSPMILDNLGLSVKVGEANETYARALGKTAASLTDAEQKTAFYNAAMAAARTKVAELGEAHTTLGDAISRAGVWWENFKTDLGIAIARSPVLNAALSEMGKAFAESFGSSNSARVKTLTALVDGLALKLVAVASTALSTGKFISEGFYLIRGVFFGVLESVANIVTTMLGANARIAEFAASIPIIGRAWTGVATDARFAADAAGAVASSFQRTKDAAFDAMGTSGAAYDSAQAKLTAMRIAMQAAAKEPIVTPATVQRVEHLAGAAGLVATKIGSGMAPAIAAVSSVLEPATAHVEALDSGLTFTAETIETLPTKLAPAKAGITSLGAAAQQSAGGFFSMSEGLYSAIRAAQAYDSSATARSKRAAQGTFDAFDRPVMPHFDTGGPVLRDGPIYAHAGEYVIPKDAGLVRGGGGSRGPITINLYGTPEWLAQQVKAVITREVLQGRKLASG